MAPKHVLITGAAGFIGSHVADALLERGDQVVVLDNFDDFYPPMLKRHNVATALGHSGYLLVEGDVRNPDDLDRVFEEGPFDAVVHLAARAGVRPSIQQPVLYDDVNVRGTTTLLEFVRRASCPHLVIASSSSVYGATSRVPFTESEPADRPSSPYAATKRANELASYAFHSLYGIDITCLRYFTVYGPRQRPEMAIHKFTRQIERGQPVEIYGDGSARRDFTYIDDIVDGTLRALDRPNGYRIFNIGTTATTLLIELVKMLGAKLGREVMVHHRPVQAGDVPITYADISRAQTELGYRPQTPLSLGLDHFVGWYRQMISQQVMGATVG